VSVKSEQTFFISLKTIFVAAGANKSQIELHFRGHSAQFCSIPACGSHATFSTPRELRNISFHPRGITACSAGFRQSPSSCRLCDGVWRFALHKQYVYKIELR